MEEILKQILAEMQDMKKEMNQRFDSVDERFTELNHKLEVIREQTAANSEIHSPVADVQKQVDDLATDVKLIKRAITNQ
ncbi:MbeD/MobD family mobilization/exclusion protein [Aneurinibacillus migulanus]|uniref:MbeD/MobD like protein n=1 Tax=Aneurinibacillus migulanus TaxID=47500 RepID=A0A0D1Y747_ANEMI|nr:MbeD/MobD family mobilization/exclusion protein [Aneurinibacillus migulanus]KIV60273.1 hypothetical protein TS65_00345 [Aneurinibacillus migulanus]KON90528.1 hypothetical protein AF333_29060 [Aneurinibacillus migulanus]MED0894885.1 MbeD/MobD family mobilization/exclusion protein [Aneurinibacillus migulanus]MED1614471.1 MbeD/MobD family mobilization/exclusion protein [Aneurinibacillus migulanus]SDJ76809.1 MbeD/MobD like protein [Aneurinibacillus migulanus]